MGQKSRASMQRTLVQRIGWWPGVVLLLIASWAWAQSDVIGDPNATADANNVVDVNESVENLPSSESALEVLMNRPEVVRSIEFAGNHKYKDKVLRKRIGIELGERYDPFLAEGGRRILIDLYKKIGYAEVEVTLDTDRAKTGRLFYVIQEGPRARITKVRFKGNRVFSNAVLAKVVKVKSKKWLLLPNYYSEDILDESVYQLQDFYHKEGYLGYTITVETQFNEPHDRVKVIFHVEEGPAYHIEKILYNGYQRYDVNELTAGLDLAEGQVYQRERADLAAKHIQEKYLKKGFLDAQVVQGPKYEPDPNEAVVTLEFNIYEGDQFRIGHIDVSGNNAVQDKVIRRVLDEYNFTPGELYDATLATAQGRSRLENYVKYATKAQDVVIRPVESAEGTPGVKDVKIDIIEGMTGMIMPAIGYSTDSGLMGHLVYQQRNFDITDNPENLKDFFTMKAYHGAGETLNLALEPGTNYHRYTVSFTNPYFRDKPIEYTLAASSYNRWYEAHEEYRGRGMVGFDFRNWGGWGKSFSVRVENVEVKDLDDDAPQAIRDAAGHTLLAGFKIGTGTYSLDDPARPTEGYKLGLYYEQVTGNDAFGILTATASRYIPLYEDVFERRIVWANKLLAGTILGEAPPFEKFYGGGMGTYAVRGFSYRGVGKHGQQVYDDGTTGSLYKDPVGSDWIFIASSEVIIPLVDESLAGLIFTDVAAMEDTFDYSWRWSAGVGLQITVPQLLGDVPMRFELGFPIEKGRDDETQTFNFSMGIPF